MADSPIPDGGLEVAKSAVSMRLKAQARIAIAGLAGAMVGKHILPASFADETMINAICALLFYGVATAWQDRRAFLNHARLWVLALDRRVPAALVRPAVETAK